MMNRTQDYIAWDAFPFFEYLHAHNRICQEKNYKLCRVSSLQGFEDALKNFQSAPAFLCVAEESDATLNLNNTGHSKFVKTIFFAKRHPVDNMVARSEAMKELRVLARQFLSRLVKEKSRINLGFLYIDNQVNFSEIPQAFAPEFACLYFNVMVGVYIDLSYKSSEWIED